MVKRILDFFRLARRAFGAYALQIGALTLLGFLSGLLGGVGINALIPLFSLALGERREADFVTRTIAALFQFSGIDFRIRYLLLFIVALFIVKAAVLILVSYISTKITAGYEEATRSRLLGAILKARWPYLMHQKLGHLDTVLMKDVSESMNFLAQISGAVMTFSALIVYAAIAVNISPAITLITFALGGTFFFASKPLIRRVKALALKEEGLNRDIAHYVNEHLVGMKAVKAFGVAQRVVQVGRAYFRSIRDIRLKSFALTFFSNNLLQPASIVFIAGVFAVSYRTPGFSIVSFAAVIYLIRQIFTYIEQLQTLLFGFNNTAPYVRMVIEAEEDAREAAEVTAGSRPFSFSGELAFDHVSFRYEDGRTALSEVSFAIRKGEMVGLIGPTGAGKTTIVDLILRLFQPQDGRILLDGVPAEEVALNQWRRHIGYVTQDVFLLNDTVLENVRFYDPTVHEDDIRAAAALAHANFIERLPAGFKSNVGERGVLLSGGERQRLAIARVLSRKPALLILDEATSAVDNESERHIREAIEGLKGMITVLVIAHRFSTVASADRLIAIEQGRIIEEGTPEGLLKDKASYFSKVYHLV